MKTKILSIVSIIAAAATLWSCSDSWEPNTSATGELALSSIGVEVLTEETVVSRAAIDLNPYIVTVFDEQQEAVRQWTFGNMPEIVSLPVGKYTVEVKSHHVKKAAWDEPLYLGVSEPVEVTKNQITNVGAVTCKFSSFKVSVKFTDELRKVMGNDVEVRVVANDEGELVFTPDEERSGYFEVVDGSMTIAAHFTGTVNDYDEHIINTYKEVEAGQHYILTYGLRTNTLEPDPETGYVDPSEGVNVQTDVEIVGQDGSVSNDEDLVDVGDGNHNSEQFVEEVDMKYDSAAGTITIAAPAGLASVTVAVGEDTNADFTSAFAALNGANLAARDCSAFGLPAPSAVTGATTLTLNLNKLITDAQEYEGNHSFTFAAADKEGSKSEPVTVTVKGKSSASSTITFETGLDLVNPMNPADYTSPGAAAVTIKSDAGIQNLFLYIDSNASDPLFVAITGILNGKDLANPDEQMKDALDNQLELANGDAVRNHNEVVFDITNFMGMLTFSGTHKFTIEVVDNNGVTESITLTFVVQ